MSHINKHASAHHCGRPLITAGARGNQPFQFQVGKNVGNLVRRQSASEDEFVHRGGREIYEFIQLCKFPSWFFGWFGGGFYSGFFG